MRFFRSLSAIEAMNFDLDDTLHDNRLVIRQLETKFSHGYINIIPYR